MASFKNNILDILAIMLLIGLFSVTSENSFGQELSCSSIMQHNILQSLKTLSPESSEHTFINDLCAGDKKSKGSLLMFGGTTKLSSAQVKASKDLLCSKSKMKGSAKKNFAKHRILKSLIGTEALNEYKKCVNLAKKGIEISSESGEESGSIVNLSVQLKNSEARIEEVKVVPADALTCSGPLASKDDQRHFSYSELIGSCQRNPALDSVPAVITIKTSSGALNINVAPASPIDGVNIDRVSPEAIPVMPQIPGCTILSMADRTMECDDDNGLRLCYGHIRSGTVVDCRFVYRENVFRNHEETQYHPAVGQYDIRTSGRLVVNVDRAAAYRGIYAGAVDYTINFRTPVLGQRPNNQCDPRCPLFGESPCNRDCVFADHVVELESYSGIASIGREAGNSCEAPLTGRLELSSIDKYRAYNLCAHQNAWGQLITGTFYAQVSKFYYFNDFRTTHTVGTERRNGRTYNVDQWNVSNHGERVRNIAELEIPIHIACNG